MRRLCFVLFVVALTALAAEPAQPPVVAKPEAFATLVNPSCSHCIDEAKRRAAELRAADRVLCWTRGYSEGGAIPYRFFLNSYRVISDSYGVFVHDPDAGFSRGYLPSYLFRFHGWRNGIMVMKHADGTLYSCLSGVAFAGPRKGSRLTPIPTLVSDWGMWLRHYPHAVAYHMFDKYHAMDLPAEPNKDALASRGPTDPRLPPATEVLGVWTGGAARAYPLAALAKSRLIADGKTCLVLWQPETKTASAYRPEALPPRKYTAPRPDAKGESPPETRSWSPPTPVTLRLDATAPEAPFVDRETGSHWDIAGRAVDGKLKGYTLTWLDSVQVKWFAWAAEYPQTTLYTPGDSSALDHKPPIPAREAIEEISGKAEFLRLLPKPFGLLKDVDVSRRTITLLADGDKNAKVWPVEPEAEIKVAGWWGRLDQFHSGERVWAWLKLDRKKKPVSVIMLADAPSERDIHGAAPKGKNADGWEQKRAEQRARLRNRWLAEGLPGTLTFCHVFTGELEVTLDHEAMRWGRSLKAGDAVFIKSDPPIRGIVKKVVPWRERTMVRLVVGELDSSDLKIGQRIGLKVTPPPTPVDNSPYPPDMDRPRSTAERIEWLLASMYCSCGVGHDTCTGHFYTLASCNPNSCGMPNVMRSVVAKKIETGRTDRQIFDELVRKHGPAVLRPHLAP